MTPISTVPHNGFVINGLLRFTPVMVIPTSFVAGQIVSQGAPVFSLFNLPRFLFKFQLVYLLSRCIDLSMYLVGVPIPDAELVFGGLCFLGNHFGNSRHCYIQIRSKNNCPARRRF